MFGRFRRRRDEAQSARPATERLEAAASNDDLSSLLQAIEEAAGEVYGRHGLPQRPGQYRCPADGGVWEPLGDALSAAEKWALIDTPPGGGRWRYAAYEALGARSDVPAVRQASALLAACQGLRQRIADHATISALDLADAIRLGEAWRHVVEDPSRAKPSAPSLRFLPPDDAG